MKIAMVGCGACGSVFASYLQKGGAEMTLVDHYKEHMDKVAKSGMKFVVHENKDGEFVDTIYNVPGFKTAQNARDIGVMDAVIFLTKSTQLEQAVIDAKPCIGESTVLVALLNGLGNDQILAKYHPADHCMYGSGTIGTALGGPGCCISTPPDHCAGVLFGPVVKSKRVDEVGNYLKECFENGGISAEYTYDVAYSVWRKAIHNSATNTMCGILRLTQGGVRASDSGRELCYRVIKEGCAVAAAYGIDFDVDDLFYNFHSNFMITGSDYYPSMAQDMLMHKRETEIDSLNGALYRMGKAVGIPAPTNEVLTLVVKGIQESYDKQYIPSI